MAERSALSKQDWRDLKKRGVAFKSMDPALFDKFLDAIYNLKDPQSYSNITEIDVLMIYAAHSEPPIPPVKWKTKGVCHDLSLQEPDFSKFGFFIVVK